MKQSKEIENICKAISAYITKHGGDVSVCASFIAFKGKESDVVDDRIFCYGSKKIHLIALKDIEKEIKKEKNDFINW